jgi:hypothetical protein
MIARPLGAAGDDEIPVPDSGAACGLPAALSVMLTLARRAPVDNGVNVTLMLQLLPAPTDDPHVFVCAKSPEFVPVIVMLEIVNVVPPVLVNVIDCEPLVVLTT